MSWVSSWIWDDVVWVMEKATAPHSSTLAWRIPGTEEPGRLQSIGSLSAGSRHIAYWVRIWNSSTGILSLPGASVRHSAHDKGHEEGGSAYAKAGSSLRSPPGNSRASTPKTRVCLLSALCSHLHLWLYGGCPPPPLCEKRVNLQLQLIKFLGVTRVF